jgi:clan AA aspartic protease (TIGR02281 family)
MKKPLLLILCFLAFTQFSYAQTYFDKALQSYEAEDYEKALILFNQELELNPKNYMAYYYNALIHKNEDDMALALTSINLGLKYVPSKEKDWLSFCLQARGDIYLAIENYENALADFTSAIKNTPQNENRYLSRAETYIQMNDYVSAEQDCKQALKIDEGNERAWTNLGKIYLFDKKYDQAEKTLNTLIKLSPKYPLGYFYRSFVYLELDRKDEAISDIFEAYILDDTDKETRGYLLSMSEKNIPLALSKANTEIRNNPNKEQWYYIRAQLYEGKEDYKTAIEDYKKLLELTDVDFRASVKSLIASCYSELGEYASAIANFDESLAIDSTRAYDYGSRADAKRLTKDYKGALEDFTKAIELNPTEEWFYYRRGWVKDEFLKDTQGGLKDYNSAIEINKDYAYTYLHRGKLYEFKLKDLAKAKKDYETILTIDTLVANNGNVRHYALFHLNRNEEATSWMDSIVNKFPNNGNYYDASCLYSLMKKPKDAISNLKLAFENGYRDFFHLAADDDLDNVRDLPEFKSLVQEWKGKTEELNNIENKAKLANPVNKQETVTIPMKPKGSGIYEVSCKINELPLNFIFDTGASDISISTTEAQFMLKNGYLKPEDFVGKQSYMDANGDIEVGTKIIFRTVNFGGIVLKNISASVVDNKNAPLLFGQSALSKYGKILIDNKKNSLTLTTY